MGDAQDKRPGLLSDRVEEAIGRSLNPPFLWARDVTMTRLDLEALLDQLDEAKEGCRYVAAYPKAIGAIEAALNVRGIDLKDRDDPDPEAVVEAVKSALDRMTIAEADARQGESARVELGRLVLAAHGHGCHHRDRESIADFVERVIATLRGDLDEAKHLHEVERDRASDLLSDRNDAERERDEARNELDVNHSSWATLFARLREVGVRVLPDSTGKITEIDQIVRAVAGLRYDVQSLKSEIGQIQDYWRGRVAGLEAQLDEARSSAEHMRQAADRVCSKTEEARAEVERLQAELEDAARHMQKIHDLAAWLSETRKPKALCPAFGEHICDAARMEIEALDERLSWFEGEPIDGRSRAGRLDLLERIREGQASVIGKQIERSEKAESRVAELEAEVERLSGALSRSQRGGIIWMDRHTALSGAVRLAHVSDQSESIARLARHAEFLDSWAGDQSGVHRELVMPSGESASSAADTPLPDLEESGDQQPLDTLDDVALAISDIRERLARLEDRDA